MRSFLASLFIVLALCGHSQNLTWGPEIEADSGSGFLKPRIALMANSVPAIIWGNSVSSPLYFSKWNGSGFTPGVQLNPPGVNVYIANWTGPSIAAKGDTVYVVFKGYPETTTGIWLMRSFDAGDTWSDTIRVDEGYGPSSFLPSVFTDEDGQPVLLFMDYDVNWLNPHYVIRRSQDFGDTFGPAVNASSPGNAEVCDCCPAEAVVRDSIIAVVFRNNDNNLRDIWYSLSADSGQSFLTGSDIDTTNWVISQCPATGPDAVIAGDTLITVWMSGASGSSRIRLNSTQAFDGGDGINRELYPVTNIIQQYPRIASSGDTVGVAWYQQQGTVHDIHFSWSVNGAAALGDTVVIANQELPGIQKNPDVAFGHGAFHFIYQDNMKQRLLYRKAGFYGVSGVGIKESVMPSITVYPNPSATGMFALAGAEEGMLAEIFDAEGRLISTQRTAGTLTHIDGRNWTPGMYLVRLTNDKDQPVVLKIFVSKSL